MDSFQQIPENKYDAIYINTPWKNLTTDQIQALCVSKIGKPDGLLFLWVDPYQIQNASKILDTWGYKFHSVFQVLDVQQYAWQKVSKPKPDVVEAIIDDEDEPQPKKRAVGPKKPRALAVHHPTWWTEPDFPLKSEKVSTEQLWLATRGNVEPLFADKPPTIMHQMAFCPDIGKKSKVVKKDRFGPLEWVSERPHSFLSLAVSQLVDSAHVLEMFGSTVNDNVDSWGPCIPGGFVPAISSNDGIVGAVSSALTDLRKTQLSDIRIKISKIILLSQEDNEHLEEQKILFSQISEIWGEIEKSASELSYPVVYSLSKDDTTGLPSMWALHLVNAIVQFMASTIVTGKKKRSRKTAGGEKEKSGEPRPGHGIAAPMDISADLSNFMGIPPGEKVARTVAVKKINEYIKEHKLQNPEKRIQIILDDKLRALLTPPDDFGDVTFFNLCKLIGRHFHHKPKAPKASKAAKVAKVTEDVEIPAV